MLNKIRLEVVMVAKIDKLLERKKMKANRAKRICERIRCNSRMRRVICCCFLSEELKKKEWSCLY